MSETRCTLKHKFTRDEAIDLFRRADLVHSNRAAGLIGVNHRTLDELIDSKALASLTIMAKASPSPLYRGPLNYYPATGITRASLVSYAAAHGIQLPKTL